MAPFWSDKNIKCHKVFHAFCDKMSQLGTGSSKPQSRLRAGTSLPLNRPFLLGRIVVPLQTMWYSLKNCSFIHLFFFYNFIYTRLFENHWKEEFSRVSLHCLKWGNKRPSQKRSFSVGDLQYILLESLLSFLANVCCLMSVCQKCYPLVRNLIKQGPLLSLFK